MITYNDWVELAKSGNPFYCVDNYMSISVCERKADECEYVVSPKLKDECNSIQDDYDCVFWARFSFKTYDEAEKCRAELQAEDNRINHIGKGSENENADRR